MGDEKIDLDHDEDSSEEAQPLSDEELGVREEVDTEVGGFSDE